jgi:glyoxylase-like metal-dependent hydrolase (beta-lactamase superfamily II)
MWRPVEKFLSGKTMMRKILSLVLVSLLGGRMAIALAASPGTAYAPVDVPMPVIKVSEHVYFVQGEAGTATENAGFISNAGFVITSDGVVVFDALGTPSLAAKMLAEIRKRTNLPIRKVVMSHYHADHLYGLQVFKEQGAEVLAPDGARTYLGSEVAETLLEARRTLLAPWVNKDTRLVPPDTVVLESQHFELGGVRFELTPVGSAHSEGDLTMLVQPDNVLFSGDIIFEQRIPFIGEANTANWLATLDGLRKVKVAAIVPGHGGLAQNPNEVVDATYRYLKFLREQMAAAIASWEPFDPAYEKIDWGEFAFLPAFDEANRRNAYNVYLSLEREQLEQGKP